MSKKNVDWVVAGGKDGEVGHCRRCGGGLSIGTPIDLPVLTAAMDAFVKAHSNCVEGRYQEPSITTPAEWADSRDTGVSSMTIYSAATGIRSRYDPHYDVPKDPDDFGRCYRLLKLFPEWRAALPMTIPICAAWRPFVENWDELTKLYEEDEPTGFAPKLYNRMRELRGVE